MSQKLTDLEAKIKTLPDRETWNSWGHAQRIQFMYGQMEAYNSWLGKAEILIGTTGKPMNQVSYDKMLEIYATAKKLLKMVAFN
jgi:hypothetical protein